MQKVKIALIIPTLRRGGAERVMSILANEFSLDNFEVHLITWAQGEDGYTINENVTQHRIGFFSKNKIHRLFSVLLTYARLRKKLKEIQPKVILSFMIKSNILSLIASRGLDIPTFVSDRSNPKKKVPKVEEILRKKMYKKASGIIAQTDLARQVIKNKTNHSNIAVIQNPAREVELYSKIEREKIIISVGRLVPEKGQKYLLKAFSLCKDENWKVIFLGQGPLLENLQSYSIELGISENCLFLGEVENVDEWLAKASIFAFPSISEGFPNALIEGMMAGLPCVSFDCDAGPSDIIENTKNGFLVELKNTEVFANRLSQLISNPSLRSEIGNNAQLIQQQLNKKMIVSKYSNFINRNL